VNKDALITELDVDGLNTEIQSKHFVHTVRDFFEGEPHLSYIMGVRLGMLSDALTAAGVNDTAREQIMESMHVTLGINMYLMLNATRRLIDNLLPSTDSGDDGGAT
jgi:hypothetical protein